MSAPLRPEDDILEQWRRRRRMEQAAARIKQLDDQQPAIPPEMVTYCHQLKTRIGDMFDLNEEIKYLTSDCYTPSSSLII